MIENVHDLLVHLLTIAKIIELVKFEIITMCNSWEQSYKYTFYDFD